MPTCFVVQGFGKKTDFTDGRVLDLDASYAVIKDAVEAAGMECVRADEIPHSGTIDVPMYSRLLEADLVIADLSTYNVNAAFELGVRYGLRPRATIIVAEEQFKNPFDVSHIVIRRYKHLGEDIGMKEAKRFSEDLKQAIAAILANGEIDSPVYTFLPTLQPPRRDMGSAGERAPVAPASAAAAAPSTKAVDEDMTVAFWSPTRAPAAADAPAEAEAAAQPAAVPANAKSLLEDAQANIADSDFVAACALLEKLSALRPNDPFVTQQLALATYKAKLPTPEQALQKAKQILQALRPDITNDPETLGLWASVHKRLWELNHQAADLEASIDACQRGYSLKGDIYSGINLAFLLDLRALESLKAGDRDEGLADSVLARRIRRQLIAAAAPQLAATTTDGARFWLLASLREAAVGLGDMAAAEQWRAQSEALQVSDWMKESSDSQLAVLEANLAEVRRLTSEPVAGTLDHAGQSAPASPERINP